MIKIELKEGKLYYVRYLGFGRLIKDLHGYLELITLDDMKLHFNREGLGDKSISINKVITICEIKSKGKRIIEFEKGD